MSTITIDSAEQNHCPENQLQTGSSKLSNLNDGPSWQTMPKSGFRLIGLSFLAAFFAYGTGAAMAMQGNLLAALALIGLNSIFVLIIGTLMYRALKPTAPKIALQYGATRYAEALLLFAGIVAWFLQPDFAFGEMLHRQFYIIAMIILAVGSLPLCWHMIKNQILPRALAWLGLIGYAIFAIGMLLDAAGFSNTAVYLLIPGALFEVIFGARLLWRGKF